MQVLELSNCLFKLFLSFLELLALIEELAKRLAFLNTLDTCQRLCRLEVEDVLAVEKEREGVGPVDQELLVLTHVFS